jgi:5'-nucleotidase
MLEKPTILVTNDDGITSKGIRFLAEVAAEFGNVIVVAPDSPQSGMGHAITIGELIRLDKVEVIPNIDCWQSSGTPVDCVKLAVNKVLHRKPDLCLSGVNHGSNSSINVIYSGTMSAAMEGAIENIPSIGFSHCSYAHDIDFEPIKPYVRKIIENALGGGLPKGGLLNVNFPADNVIEGMKICRQAVAKWEEDFEERKDPSGRKYYWLTGKFILNDKGTDTDEWALRNKYASIVPVQYDFTDHPLIPKLSNWKLDV